MKNVKILGSGCKRCIATADMASANYVLVHHELHFREVDYQAWVAFGTTRPAYVLTFEGVPIVSVYRGPWDRASRSEGAGAGDRPGAR